MVARLPAWAFLSLALALMGFAQLPLLRFALGIDEQISLSSFTVAMFMIGGLMSALCAMLLLARREAAREIADRTHTLNLKQERCVATAMQASGLLLFSGLPLLHFLLIYFLWAKYRSQSNTVDEAGRQAINFQISVHLYLLISIFFVFILVGYLTTLLLLVFYFACVLSACWLAWSKRPVRYPTNIQII